MNNSKLHNLFGIIIAAMCIIAMPLESQASTKAKKITAQKERLVLMPLRVPEEDKNLIGAMETALVNGLQQKYDVYSGEQVSQKAHQIFMKESRNTSHKECDETKCMQNIAMAFQAELIATANVTLQDGSYFLALSIQNIFDNKVVQSESLPCEKCTAVQVVEKLKELSGAIAPEDKIKRELSVAEEVRNPAPSNPNKKNIASKQNPSNWVKVGESSAFTDYIDIDNIVRHGDHATIWHLQNFKERLGGEGNQFLSVKFNLEFDCTARMDHALYYATFSGSMGNGRLVDGGKLVNDPMSAWKKISDGELVDKKYACDTQKSEAVSETQANISQHTELPKGFVFQGGLTWMPVSFGKNWNDANSYCSNTAINGQTGWRLPTKYELSVLFDSGEMNGQGWTLNYVWSSTPLSNGYHYTMFLYSGNVDAKDDTNQTYVTCVRAEPESASETKAKQKLQAGLPKGFVFQGGLTWMPISSFDGQKNWDDANAYCANTTINGQTGWRLPTKEELSDLFNSGAMNNQGWFLHDAWSSTPSGGRSHYLFSLLLGLDKSLPDGINGHVTCVR